MEMRMTFQSITVLLISNFIDKSDILNIHKYLMTKINIR